MTRSHTLFPVVLSALALAVGGCGTSTSGGGGGGSVVVGGAIGTPCDLQYSNEGCAPGTNPARLVVCKDAAGTGAGTWQQKAACAAGQYCSTETDPSDPSNIKKLANCKTPLTTGGDAGLSDVAVTDSGVADAGVGDTWKADGVAKTDTKLADTGSATDAVPSFVCGNGKCESGESTQSCPADCKPTTTTCGSNKDCASGQVCLAGESGSGKYGKGCSAAADQAFMSKLNTSTSLANAMSVLVSDCTLKKGCLAKSDSKAKQDCITTCIATDSFVTSNNVSMDCAACFGVYKGFCGADKCIAKCAADPTAQKCSDCLKSNCDSEYEKCLAGDKTVAAAGLCVPTSAAKGCTTVADQAFLTYINTNTSGGSAIASLVGDCTLQKGCLSKPDAPSKKACITACIAGSSLLTSQNVSQTCAACFGEFKGFCGADKCIANCAADPSSQKCSTCLATNCDPAFEACVAGK